MKTIIVFLALTTLLFGCSSTKKSQKNAEPSQVVTSQEKPIFSISRTFDADAKSIFKMWIKPNSYVKWMGPTGAKMSFVKTNIKAGESSRWKMTTPDGLTKFGELHYKMISSPDLLIYVQNFCDEKGNLTKLPMNKPYPNYLIMRATMDEIAPKKTNLTVTWEIFGAATEEENQTFNSMKPFMATGWGQSFDKLAELLKK